jgi:hypothetical protein
MQTFSPVNTFTITLASLANNTEAVSSAIDNTVSKYESAQFQLKVTTGATVDSAPELDVQIYGSLDGTTYASHLTAADMMLQLPRLAAAKTYIFNFETPVGYKLPPFFKLRVVNRTGSALNATGGNHSATFVGVKEGLDFSPAAAANLHAPASNTAAIVTYSAIAGKQHAIERVIVSYVGGTVAGGNLKIEDGSGTTVFSADIKNEGVYDLPTKLKGTTNTALIVTLAAGGVGVSGKVNVVGKTQL